MLNITSLEQTLIALIEEAEFDKETLENIVTNCKSEIESETITSHTQYYIELVCKCHAYAMVALSKIQ